MAWALWRHQQVTQRAMRLHVKFDLAAGAPVAAAITPGAKCERAAWRAVFKKDELYVGDRYYGEDYALLEQARAAGCAFVVRLREQAYVEVVEELALTEEDATARVTRAQRVMIGRKHPAGPFVLVEVAGEKGALRLLSSLTEEELPAHAVAVLYRQRWMWNCFFAGSNVCSCCRHWLAESGRGVARQIYCALKSRALARSLLRETPGEAGHGVDPILPLGIRHPGRALSPTGDRTKKGLSRARGKLCFSSLGVAELCLRGEPDECFPAL